MNDYLRLIDRLTTKTSTGDMEWHHVSESVVSTDLGDYEFSIQDLKWSLALNPPSTDRYIFYIIKDKKVVRMLDTTRDMADEMVNAIRSLHEVVIESMVQDEDSLINDLIDKLT